MLKNGYGVNKLLTEREQRLRPENERMQNAQLPLGSCRILPPTVTESGPLPPSTSSLSSLPINHPLQPNPLQPVISQQTSSSNGNSDKQKHPCTTCKRSFKTWKQFEKHICSSSDVHGPANDLEYATHDHDVGLMPDPIHQTTQELESYSLAPRLKINSELDEFLKEFFEVSKSTEPLETCDCFVCGNQFMGVAEVFSHDCVLSEPALHPFEIVDLPDSWTP